MHDTLDSGCVCFWQDTEQDAERAHQMTLLRRLCLPMMSFLLLTVLQRTERHQECLRLADIIASEQHRLYEVWCQSPLENDCKYISGGHRLIFLI